MARSSPSSDVAIVMLRDLKAAESLAASLSETAPLSVASAGGAHRLVAKHGRRSGAWFWSIAPMPEALWVAMAEEHQAQYRVNSGDDLLFDF